MFHDKTLAAIARRMRAPAPSGAPLPAQALPDLIRRLDAALAAGPRPVR